MKTLAGIITVLTAMMGFQNFRPVDDLKSTEPMMSRPVVGEPYEFAIEDIDGKILRSDDMLGKVIIIDFWASWCDHCRRATPILKRLRKKYGKKLKIVGVSFDDSVDNIRAYIKKNKAAWPQVFGHGKAAPAVADARSGVSGIPYYLIIDKQGILRKMKEGGVPPQKLIGSLIDN